MMDRVEELQQELRALKKERKEIKKSLGKRSVEYAELTEEVDAIKEAIAFEQLHH